MTGRRLVLRAELWGSVSMARASVPITADEAGSAVSRSCLKDALRAAWRRRVCGTRHGGGARVRGEDVVYLGSRDGHDRQVGFMMMLYIVGEKQDYCGRANAVKQIIIGADKRGLNFLSARINNFVSVCQR